VKLDDNTYLRRECELGWRVGDFFLDQDHNEKVCVGILEKEGLMLLIGINIKQKMSLHVLARVLKCSSKLSLLSRHDRATLETIKIATCKTMDAPQILALLEEWSAASVSPSVDAAPKSAPKSSAPKSSAPKSSARVPHENPHYSLPFSAFLDGHSERPRSIQHKWTTQRNRA
jgi:hypothetical protein